jgi:RimJ/RimL family protein N-acetyltransferase
VELLPYGESDWPLTAALETDPVVMRHLGGSALNSAAGEARLRMVHDKRLAGAAFGDRYRTIVPDGATAPVGVVAIWRTPWQGQFVAELGVMLMVDYQRSGLGVAAAWRLIDEVRAEGTVHELHAFTEVDNDGGTRTCRQLGFTLVGSCDLDYEGEPLRCNHWLKALSPVDQATGPT